MAHINLVTEIPGPESRKVIERHEKYVARTIREAEGALLTDVDGNRFIDLAGGVGVLNVGHSDPGVVGSAEEQPGRLVHTDYTVAPYAPYGELARRHHSGDSGGGRAALQTRQGPLDVRPRGLHASMTNLEA